MRWSDLEKVLGEALGAARRAQHEDTSDTGAEQRYLHLVEKIWPKAEVAAQRLKEKLLAGEGYEPGHELHEAQ